MSIKAIFVDADACPVKHLIEQIAVPMGVPIVYVTATSMKRRVKGTEVVFVDKCDDAADDYIIRHAPRDALVVTNDVELGLRAEHTGRASMDFRGLPMSFRRTGRSSRSTFIDRNSFRAALSRIINT
jgi:uncharacterized protein YaiI (UPF0178 family)